MFLTEPTVFLIFLKALHLQFVTISSSPNSEAFALLYTSIKNHTRRNSLSEFITHRIRLLSFHFITTTLRYSIIQLVKMLTKLVTSNSVLIRRGWGGTTRITLLYCFPMGKHSH